MGIGLVKTLKCGADGSDRGARCETRTGMEILSARHGQVRGLQRTASMCFRCARRQAGLQTRSDVRRDSHKRQNNIRRSALRVYIDSPGFAASIDRRFGPFSLHQPNRVELSLYDSIHSYKQGRAANMARGLLVQQHYRFGVYCPLRSPT